MNRPESENREGSIAHRLVNSREFRAFLIMAGLALPISSLASTTEASDGPSSRLSVTGQVTDRLTPTTIPSRTSDPAPIVTPTIEQNRSTSTTIITNLPDLIVTNFYLASSDRFLPIIPPIEGRVPYVYGTWKNNSTSTRTTTFFYSHYMVDYNGDNIPDFTSDHIFSGAFMEPQMEFAGTWLPVTRGAPTFNSSYRYRLCVDNEIGLPTDWSIGIPGRFKVLESNEDNNCTPWTSFAGISPTATPTLQFPNPVTGLREIFRPTPIS